MIFKQLKHSLQNVVCVYEVYYDATFETSIYKTAQQGERNTRIVLCSLKMKISYSNTMRSVNEDEQYL